MNWWRMGGLNPTFKEFADAHPDKTLVGLMWSLQWRFMLFMLALELIVILAFFIIRILILH